MASIMQGTTPSLTIHIDPDLLNYLVTTEGFTVGTDCIEVDETLREICIV